MSIKLKNDKRRRTKLLIYQQSTAIAGISAVFQDKYLAISFNPGGNPNRFMRNLIITRSAGVMITNKFNTILCHCEERSDAAISMYHIVV